MCLKMLYFLICEKILNLGPVKYTVLLPVCFLYVSAVIFFWLYRAGKLHGFATRLFIYAKICERTK
jgi:hypothetical protein